MFSTSMVFPKAYVLHPYKRSDWTKDVHKQSFVFRLSLLSLHFSSRCNSINLAIFVYYNNSQTSMKTNKKAAMLNSPKTKSLSNCNI